MSPPLTNLYNLANAICQTDFQSIRIQILKLTNNKMKGVYTKQEKQLGLTLLLYIFTYINMGEKLRGGVGQSKENLEQNQNKGLRIPQLAKITTLFFIGGDH